MRFLPFRILLLCVLMPPLLYMGTLKGIEEVLQVVWRSDLQNSLITDTTALLQGRERVESMVERNIRTYFDNSVFASLGAVPDITARTEDGRILYPEAPEEVTDFASQGQSLTEDEFGLPPDQIAERNVSILQDGVVFSLNVFIPRSSWLANFVLAFYILLFVGLLHQAYRIRSRRAEEAEAAREQELKSLQQRLGQEQERVQETQAREKNYNQEIARLKSALSQADSRLQETEEEALAELEALERKLEQSVAAREQREEEIENLSREMEKLQASGKSGNKKQDKQVDQALKRFKTLYKNLEFHRRAVEGFLQLSQEQQLKSEELIHLLDRDASAVKVKRKVFSKTGAAPALETEFAHRGRIYWRRGANGKTVVLAIGTKNTQTKDLHYLEGLSGDEE